MKSGLRPEVFASSDPSSPSATTRQGAILKRSAPQAKRSFNEALGFSSLGLYGVIICYLPVADDC